MKRKLKVYRNSMILFGLTTFVALFLPNLWHGSVRQGALVGVTTAVVASGVAFLLLELTLDRGLKPVLAAMVGSLLCRLLLVAGGLVWAITVKANLIAFCTGFFMLYMSHQAIELMLVARRSLVSAEGNR